MSTVPGPFQNDTAPDDASPEPKSRIPWLPFAWTGIIGGICLFVQASTTTQDYKNSAIAICIAVWLLGWTAWVLVVPRRSAKLRWSLAVGPWLVLLAFFMSVDIVNNGDVGIVGWRWRWLPAPDETLEVPESATATGPWETTPQDYPRFLGDDHWAEVSGVQLSTDWESEPPQELWRAKVGAGWSAFAIVNDFAVTQEQRGDQELVVCYRVSTDQPQGEVVWAHADPVRFDPAGRSALGDVGPRATPTIYQGRVYSVGATGIFNCLEARTGQRLWSHDTLAENGAENIMWGKANSPLIVPRDGENALVVVSVGAPEKSLIAYDAITGDEVWAAGSRRSSYASPVLAELVGELQVLSVNEDYVTAHRASDGRVLWEHEWPGNSDTNATVSQPIPLEGDRVFLSKGYGIGSTLVQLHRNEQGQIETQPLWQPPIKQVMKTKMGNVVIRDGYVYGLDGGILQCIELVSGKSQWKKRRRPNFGHGQIMLIGDVMLILSESGEVILVDIDPDEYRELASFRAFPDDQVTWNNPAFSAPFLLVRNSEQAACYRLPLVPAVQTAASQ